MLISIFYFTDVSWAPLANLNVFIERNALTLLGFSTPSFVYVLWKSSFIEFDTSKQLKDFPDIKRMYLISRVEILYFTFFSIMLLCGGASLKLHGIFFPKLYPLMSALGLIILIGSMGINCLVLNRIFRDNG